MYPMPEGSQRIRKTAYIAVPLLLALNVFIYIALLAPPRLTVTILPLGSAAAFLVAAPEGTPVLVGAGPDASVLRALGETLAPWQRSLSALVLTSISGADAGGAPEMLARYRVAEIVRPEAKGTASREAALAEASAASGTHLTLAHRGDRFALGGGAYLDVLWPPETATLLRASDGPLVLRLSYGRTAIDIAPDSLPASDAAWLAALDAGLPAAALTLSSSTPAGTYVSDGIHLYKE